MNTTHPAVPTSAQIRTRSPVQFGAVLCGFFFLVIGFAGFVPTVTTHFNSMEMGFGSEAMLLGLFQVSVLHNVVHLLCGLAGLALSRLVTTARAYLLLVGVFYAVLWLFGLLVDKDSMANFVPLNTADVWLSFVLAVTMIGLGIFLPSDEHDPPGTRATLARTV
jgi:hypothetical protein